MNANNPKQDKLFIVDDDVMTAELYKQHLQNLGYDDVTVFESGLDALQALIQEPTIILLDHQMENMSGIEVLRKIKRFDPNTYVVFISGQEDVKTAVESLKFGAFDYIVKGDQDTERITQVLQKIENVRKLLKRRDPGFIGKILSTIL